VKVGIGLNNDFFVELTFKLLNPFSFFIVKKVGHIGVNADDDLFVPWRTPDFSNFTEQAKSLQRVPGIPVA